MHASQPPGWVPPPTATLPLTDRLAGIPLRPQSMWPGLGAARGGPASREQVEAVMADLRRAGGLVRPVPFDDDAPLRDVGQGAVWDRLLQLERDGPPDLPRLMMLANGLAHAVPAADLLTVPARSSGVNAAVVPVRYDLIGWSPESPRRSTIWTRS